MRSLLPLCLLVLAGCASYRSVNGGWRSPSDYANGRTPASVIPVDQPFTPRGAFALTWPVERVRVNRGFLARSGKRPHQGVDLGGTRGTPILAAHEGRVIYTGNQFRGFGKMVLVEYDKHWATLYGHLDAIDVREGQIVSAGETLGGMGQTGRASGVHLHFELMRDRQLVDPLPYLTRPGRLVLNTR